MKTLIQKKYQKHIPCSFAYKVDCIGDRSSKPIVVFRGKSAADKFIKAILEEYEYCEEIIKQHFNKNLIMSEREQKQYQLSNTCWIDKKNLLIITMKKLEIIVT